jgi:hypothetical protein
MGFFNGMTKDTPKKFMLGAGAFFKNYEYGVDSYETAKASGKLLGATTGGGSFTATPTVRQTELDGAPANTAELQNIDEWAVSMVANVKEATAALLQAALGAADIDESDTDYDKVTARGDVESGDYLDNITWIGRISGSDKPVIIILKNAMSHNGLALTMADKSEAVIAVTIIGHYALEDIADGDYAAPFEIYFPKITSSTPTADPESDTFDKNSSGENYDDMVTAISGGTLTALKLGGATVNTDNYTVASGTLTIKKEYLAGLAEGIKIFTIVTANGNCTFTVTITDTTE